MQIWFYAISSVFFVSLLSLVGFFILPFGKEKLNEALIYFVSFAAGTLLGDAFIHLIPEAYEKIGIYLQVSLYILSGIIAFLFWRSLSIGAIVTGSLLKIIRIRFPTSF